MLAQRSTHYWLWFILFGVILAIVEFTPNHPQTYTSTSETWWLLIVGLRGIVFGTRVLSGFARPFDLVVGILFTGVGLLGILNNLGAHLITSSTSVANGAVSNSGVLGLSFLLPFALIHMLFGLTSLNSGLRARAASSSVVVGTQAAA